MYNIITQRKEKNMEYKYYNQFNLSEQLAQAISTIISKKEKENYVCKILKLTIPKHKDMVFHSPLTNEDICRPGASALNGSQIKDINEKYGWYAEEIIPAKEYLFFVVMKIDNLEDFSKISFESRNKLEDILQSYCIICESYFGTFDARTLIQTFPYLQDFFTSLDNWRAQTGRVTIDDNVLNKSTERTLCKIK